MSLRLLLIETRRNVGLWLVPAILLVAWWLLSARGWVAILWRSTNEELQAVVVPFAAPAMAGAAAWMAGRERRRGMTDLLATTPRAPLARGLTLWAATALWGTLAYAVVAAYVMGRTALAVTWGGPDPWRVALVLAAILAAAGWGFFVGGLFPSRFTAPIVAVAAFGLVLFLSNYEAGGSGGYGPTWVTYLAPDKTTYNVTPWQALLYAGLTGAGLAALALRCRRDLAGWAALIATIAVVVAGAVMIWGVWPRYDPVTRQLRDGWGRPVVFPVSTLPEPVCAGSPVTVCLYPEYQPLLDEAAAEANRLAEPLLGLPGVPLTVEEDVASFVGGGTSSMLEVGDRAWIDVTGFADRLVADPASPRDGLVVNEAQIALRSWLLERAAIASYWRCDDPRSKFSGQPGWPTPQTCAATERFAALAPAEQRAWLEAHYADLRAGRLSLADLP